MRWHLRFSSPVGHPHFRWAAALFVGLHCANAQGRARRVHRDVSATQDDHLLSHQIRVVVHVRSAQEVVRGQHLRQIDAGDGRADVRVGADAHEDRIVLILERRNVIDPRVQLQIDPQVDDLIDFALQDVRRKAVLGDSNPHHPAGHRKSLKHRNIVAL